MADLTFKNKTLKRQFASYKWARNNTLQTLKVALEADIMTYSPYSTQHSVLYQFQCLAAADDAYYRKLTNHSNQRFGIVISESGSLAKENIRAEDLKQLLRDGMFRLEELLATYSDSQFEEKAQTIQSILNHEYLHQGQLVVLFRQAGIELPERFKKAFDL